LHFEDYSSNLFLLICDNGVMLTLCKVELLQLVTFLSDLPLLFKTHIKYDEDQ